MAGVAGFEPTHDGIKTRCLTAWRYPCIVIQVCKIFDALSIDNRRANLIFLLSR